MQSGAAIDEAVATSLQVKPGVGSEASSIQPGSACVRHAILVLLSYHSGNMTIPDPINKPYVRVTCRHRALVDAYISHYSFAV